MSKAIMLHKLVVFCMLQQYKWLYNNITYYIRFLKIVPFVETPLFKVYLLFLIYFRMFTLGETERKGGVRNYENPVLYLNFTKF